jgi:Zn-dependent peptidase ImmA (M78 family)
MTNILEGIMKKNLYAAGYWDAVDVSTALLNSFGITSPPVNVEMICKRYRLTIVTRQMYPMRANLRRKVISISPMPESRRRFYIAHELAHYLLPKDYHEFSMNTFAACLLIPHHWLMRDMKICSVAVLSDKYGVTLPVMKLRLRQIGLRSLIAKPF